MINSEKIRERIKDPADSLNQFYRVVNNLMYRKSKKMWKAYIPNALRTELIREVHQLYGHLGATRLYHLLNEHFTMAAMLKIIKQCIKGCDTCQKCKDYGNRNLVGETKPILPKQRGDLVSVDYYGPLPVGSGNVKYIFVVVDNFIKFVKLYAI